MAQIFHRSFNTLSRVSIFGGVFIVAAIVFTFAMLDRSAYNTRKGVVLAQPVPFSHDHHTAALGISCLYCHSSVEDSSFAGVPPTATCMNCHNLIWKDSPMLEPVRESFRTGEPIRWARVHDLPDFVYFDHGIHVAKGIGCVSCHGRVDKMPLIYQHGTLQMEWCLSCHRHPETAVRPRERVLDMAWEAEDQETLGPALVAEYNVRSLDDCTTCHR